MRWVFLLALLTAELLALTSQYQVPTLFTPRLSFHEDLGWSAALFRKSKDMWQLALWISGACLCILSPRLKSIAGELRLHALAHRWTFWLIVHGLALTAFIVATSLVFARPTDPARLAAPWLATWSVLAVTTIVPWLLAVAPSRFWLQLVRRERTALLIGCLVGTSVWLLVGMFVRQEAPLAQKALWGSLSEATLHLVYWLLGWVYKDLVYQPDVAVVGTASFHVRISYACSGIEGVSLITLFLGLYLWLFRRELRFPQAFWLFPLGMLAMWLTNALRITLLIAIGTDFSREVALGGFHAQAGWIAFILIAVGLIAVAHKTKYFALAPPGPMPLGQGASLAAALLVPLMVLMAASAVTSAVSAGFDTLYALRALAASLALWYYRKAYRGLGWSVSWQAAALGIVVFGLWMVLEPKIDDSQSDLARGLSQLSPGTAAAWITFRVFGSVLVVPVVEELAFRGYLLRKLTASNFEDVRLGHFTVFAFLTSSLLFGLLHGRWLAGTLAGMVYALALHRRGQIGDAVLAHVTTNALIAVWVLVMGRWGLW